VYFPLQYGNDVIAVSLTGQAQAGTGTLVAPAVYRQQAGADWTRWSTVLAQNTANVAAPITVRFFDANGAQVGADCNLNVPRQSYAALNLKTGVDLQPCNILGALGNNFVGSMSVTSNNQAVLGITYLFYESTRRTSGDALIRP
jgi:hypothetical protein